MDIFLTGATGFLGGELLVMLSKDKRVNKIFCLVRADGQEAAMTRLRKQFDLHNDFLPEGKVVPVVGNLIDSTLPQKLNMHGDLSKVDVVVHSAADTHFMASEFVERVNVGGSKLIAEWAMGLKNLKTFAYIGTATICGKEANDRLVLEDESPNTAVEHMVRYTKTKMLAEIAVRDIVPREKMLIIRPSSVMGDSRENFKPRDFAILWVLIAINELRLIPSRNDAMIELLGVDYVAEAIHRLLFVNRRYDTYHISSGTSSSSTLNQLSDAMRFLDDKVRPEFCFVGRGEMSTLKKWARLISRKSVIEQNGYEEYIAYWKSNFGDNGNLRIILRCLDDYLRFADQGIVFDNSRLLKDTGIDNPVPAYKYLANNWKYMKEIDVMEWALNS